MDFGRRSFLSMLGGLIMGKIAGPVETPAAEPREFAKVTRPDFPKTPIRNVYLPLEMVCAATAKTLEEELKWLRLGHRVIPDEMFDRYIAPVKYSFDLHRDPSFMRVHEVHEVRPQRCYIDIPDHSFRQGDLRAAEHHIRGAAYGLADEITKLVRLAGGAEQMLMAKLPIIEHVDKCVVATSEDRGFSVRGTRHFDIRDNRMVTRVDVRLGVVG